VISSIFAPKASSSNVTLSSPPPNIQPTLSSPMQNTSMSIQSNISPSFSFSKQKVYDDDMFENMDVTTTVSRSTSGGSGFEDIIKLQKANGSWEWNDIVRLISAFSSIESSSPVNDNTIWATAVIISYLEAKFSGSRNLWSLSTKKATVFVKKECSKKGFDYDTVISKAAECTSTL